MVDIALRDAQIVWHSGRGFLPAVKLVGHPAPAQLTFDRSWGACDRAFRETTDEARLDMLLRQFVYMTVCEGLDPFELHLTLMDIPEYRAEMESVATIDPALVSLWQTYRGQRRKRPARAARI